VVTAERLRVFNAQKLRQNRVIAQTRVLIQGQVNPIERQVIVQKELDPFPVGSQQSLSGAPKKPVVNKEHTRFSGGSLLKNFQARVNRKGNFLNFRSVVVNLQAVKRRIRIPKSLYVQYAAKKFVKFATGKRHKIPLRSK